MDIQRLQKSLGEKFLDYGFRVDFEINWQNRQDGLRMLSKVERSTGMELGKCSNIIQD